VLRWLSIAEGNRWGSHHLLGWSGNKSLASWLPNRFKMNRAGLFPFEVDLEPVIAALTHAKRGKFDCSLSDKIAITNIFIKNFEVHVVPDVLDINFEELVGPFGIFAGVLHGFSTDALLACIYYDVGVHLTERLGIAR
jgi:hypothetical protein